MNSQDPSRREFVSRSIKAGLGMAGVAAVGLGRHRMTVPALNETADSRIVIPDFSLSGKKKALAVAHGKNRAETLAAVLKKLGGIDTFIQKGDRVLLKVNAAFASPAELCATSHPDLVNSLARLCFDAGARSVTVTDNPINSPDSCFMLSGIARAAEAGGAKLVLPRKNLFRSFSLEGGALIKDWPLLYEPLAAADKVIGLAPLKHHNRSGASMTLKNWYGLLGGRRNIFHQDIHNIIKELGMMIKPTLSILDATTIMMTNGPTGGSLADLAPGDTMIAGTDPVAVDTAGVALLGLQSRDLPYLAKAEQAGVGQLDYTAYGVERLRP